MKNYKFSLQSVLQVRDNEEKNVLEDFVLTQNKLDKEYAKIEELQRSLETCLEKRSPIKNIQELMMENFYKVDLEDKIKFQDRVIEQGKIELEEVREKLQIAQKDKKIIEKLKEKDLYEYKSEMEKNNQKEIDEFAVLRFKTS